MNELGLQILNCVWDGFSEFTWFTEENAFTLDVVCMDGRVMKSAGVLHGGDVIETDHAAIRVEK